MDIPRVQNPFRPTGPQHWEDQKVKITEAYTTMKLSDVMKMMEETHKFKASENQYKKQLRKWGLDNKRIKAPEYKAMIRKKRQREDDDPSKKTIFLLRDKEVEVDKIARFQKRRKSTDSDRLSDHPTPPDLQYFTPNLGGSTLTTPLTTPLITPLTIPLTIPLTMAPYPSPSPIERSEGRIGDMIRSIPSIFMEIPEHSKGLTITSTGTILKNGIEQEISDDEIDQVYKILNHSSELHDNFLCRCLQNLEELQGLVQGTNIDHARILSETLWSDIDYGLRHLEPLFSLQIAPSSGTAHEYRLFTAMDKMEIAREVAEALFNLRSVSPNHYTGFMDCHDWRRLTYAKLAVYQSKKDSSDERVLYLLSHSIAWLLDLHDIDSIASIDGDCSSCARGGLLKALRSRMRTSNWDLTASEAVFKNVERLLAPGFSYLDDFINGWILRTMIEAARLLQARRPSQGQHLQNPATSTMLTPRQREPCHCDEILTDERRFFFKEG